MKQKCALLLVIALTIGPFLDGQKSAAPATSTFDLSIDNIMRGPGLFGNPPTAVRWSPDSKQLFFQWKKYDEAREKNIDTYVINADGSALRKLSEEETKDAPPLIADWSKDKKRAVFADAGDLYMYDASAMKRHALTKTNDVETNPRFTRDQKHITFMRSGNLYLLSLDDGFLQQLTDIQAAGAAATPAAGAGGGRGGRGGGGAPPVASATGEQKGTDSQEYLKKEEKELLDIIKRRADKRAEDEAKRKKEQVRKPFTPAAGQNVQQMQLSPDGKQVFATINEAATGAKSTIVPNYVTESAYIEDIPARTNVGDTQNRSRIAIIDVTTGEVKYVDHGQKPTAAELAAAAAATPAPAEGATARGGAGRGGAVRPPAERDVQLSMPIFSEDGARAVVVGRASDNKDRWIFALDTATGKTRVLFTDHDDAWINGGGGGGFGGGGAGIGWMKDDKSIYFLSEKPGYSHLFTVAFDGGEAKQLTSGKFEVSALSLSEDKSRFFFISSEPDPSDRRLYVMAADGGARTCLTPELGQHQTFLSPDESKIADIYSYVTRPPDLYVQAITPGAKQTQLTHSPAPDFANFQWQDAPIVHYAARDGAMVPARLYKPAGWKPGGPGVVFVHGAGYAQNVHHGWSTNYSHEYAFHHFLMAHGYLVMECDYRASAGYGRDWRTAIYRHMGGTDLDDEVDLAKFMTKEYGVDAQRIGIYGGSYGGFMTLMALFTAPDAFAAGAALRPVTDWAHYNHGYTANILNTPQKDAEAYKKSSPIYFAQGLKGALLICHGMVDTNVPFQDSVRLVQRLIELRKENWSIAIYPVEDHGFLEPTSWADEYKRIFKLFETNLKKPVESAPVKTAKKKG